MSTHNVCSCEQIRKISIILGHINALSGAVFRPDTKKKISLVSVL